MAADSVGRRPVKLGPNPVHGFYKGGSRWRAFRGVPRHRPTIGPKTWVASCITANAPDPAGRPQGLSYIDGPPRVALVDAIREQPTAWLGADGAPGDFPPFQVKLVAPRDRVPLHSHPDGVFARQHHSTGHGKAEAGSSSKRHLHRAAPASVGSDCGRTSRSTDSSRRSIVRTSTRYWHLCTDFRWPSGMSC